jgi:hypothetical protein
VWLPSVDAPLPSLPPENGQSTNSHNTMSRPSIPLIAGAGALICVGLFSAALLMIEGEEDENRLIEIASTVVPETLLTLRQRH